MFYHYVGKLIHHRIIQKCKLALVDLSEYLNQKPFGRLTSDDVVSFLDKLRKTEDKDPLHKWVGTYNLKREILRQFFTWFNDPNTKRNHRSRPKIMENIPKFKIVQRFRTFA